MYITILCKVVDNFGDIGVVYRLAKQLKKIDPENQINLVTDNLDSFSKICSEVNPSQNFQILQGLNVYDWNAQTFCHEAFSRNNGELMAVILECFQCGRPDWMEHILFDEKIERTVQIIMIDYLTAEKYAEDFHCLQSLTRSAKVRKVNFMPGFTEKTGGLIIDGAWAQEKKRNLKGDLLIFTYERNWKALAFSSIHYCKKINARVLLAQGRGRDSFIEAWNEVSLAEGLEVNRLEQLPYLNQNEWDELMRNCSILVVRGEESMSRACISGIPFIWHAYPQSDEYQLVKVRALLERMRQHFSSSDFTVIEKIWLIFNSPENNFSDFDFESACDDFFNAADNLEYGFKDFARSLRKNGDLGLNLMTFIKKLDIMD